MSETNNGQTRIILKKTRLLNHLRRKYPLQKRIENIQFESKRFTDKMLVRLSLMIILVQVLDNSYCEVVIEKARMQQYMFIENDKIIRHVQGVDLQDSDLDLNGVLRAGIGQSVPEHLSRSQGRSSVNNDICKPGEWRDFWGRCRELY